VKSRLPLTRCQLCVTTNCSPSDHGVYETINLERLRSVIRGFW
jgi:hypothetical protein